MITLYSDELRGYSELSPLRQQIEQHGWVPLHGCADQFDIADAGIGFLLYPNQPFIEEADRYAKVLTAIAEGKFIVLNGIAGRFIGANKRVLAVLSDPRFSYLFTERQLAGIDALVPWSRTLGDGINIGEAVRNRTDLVIKAPFGALSRSVYLGREQSDPQWRELLERGARQGWLAQEFVSSPHIPTSQGPLYRILGAGLLSGRPIGYTARLSTSRLATLGPRCGIHAVFGNNAPDSALNEDR
jgi:hypothetical protein